MQTLKSYWWRTHTHTLIHTWNAFIKKAQTEQSRFKPRYCIKYSVGAVTLVFWGWWAEESWIMHVVLKCHIGKCHVMEMNEGTSSEPLMCRHRHDTLDPNQMLVYHLSIKMNYVHSDILRMNFKLFSSVFSALLFEYSHFTDFLILASVFQNSKYLAHVHSRTTVWVFLGAVSGIDFISNILPPPKDKDIPPCLLN